MPEMTVILIIGGLTALVFGGGVVTAAKVMMGRKTSKPDKSEE